MKCIVWCSFSANNILQILYAGCLIDFHHAVNVYPSQAASTLPEDRYPNTGPWLGHHPWPALINSLKVHRRIETERKTEKQNLIFGRGILKKRRKKTGRKTVRATDYRQRREEKSKRVMRNIQPKIVFPVSVLITPHCTCIVVYLRQCVENQGSVGFCCFAAPLHFCLSPVFSLKVFLPLSQSPCQDKDVTPQTGTTKRASKKKKEEEKKEMHSALSQQR